MRKTKDPVVYIGGPRTEEGKQRASQNAIKHGLFARNLVLLEGETQAQFDAVLERFLEDHKPEGPTEEHLVRHLADLDWRISRIVILEARALQADPTGKALGTFGIYSKRMSSEFQSTLKTLHAEQAPRLLALTQQYRLSVLLREYRKRENIDWDPGEMGFVFSKENIDRQIEANKTWDRDLRKPIMHATTRWQDELFMKFDL